MPEVKQTGSQTGIIFHIIHGSFVDGHGIRTTVFLKGCPLRCLWCCNPEGQQGHPEIKLTASLCNSCGKCVPVCPNQAIYLNPVDGDNRIKIDRERCNHCEKCLDVCFTGALDRFYRYITVDELFNIIIKDEQYYRASGGGVTIGGGEPSFQSRFTLAFLRKCKENYIHTAVDTCGYTQSAEALRVLEEADLLLYDIKGMDPERHLSNTGVANEVILSNLQKLDAMHKPSIIRLPVIPTYNDSLKNIQATAEFLAGLKHVERVDILAYHEYGKIKYAQLGRIYPLNLQPLTNEQINEIKTTLERYGLQVQIGG